MCWRPRTNSIFVWYHNDCITGAIEALSVFPLCLFEPETLYGAVDGQKFGVERPTVKARYSRKYFGRCKHGGLHTAV